MIKAEKKINENRTLKYWEVCTGGNTGLVIQENFYEDGEYVADYIIDRSNDFRFHAYKDLNFEEYEKEICHSFSFEIDHPLFIPFLNLLGGSDELVIEDDATRECNKKFIRIYRKLNTIYLDFMKMIIYNYSYRKSSINLWRKNERQIRKNA